MRSSRESAFRVKDTIIVPKNLASSCLADRKIKLSSALVVDCAPVFGNLCCSIIQSLEAISIDGNKMEEPVLPRVFCSSSTVTTTTSLLSEHEKKLSRDTEVCERLLFHSTVCSFKGKAVPRCLAAATPSGALAEIKLFPISGCTVPGKKPRCQ